MPASSIPPVETRLHSYRIVKMKPKSSDHAEPGFDLKGASAPSWTCVNNCTEDKKHTILKQSSYVNDEPEQYETEQMTKIHMLRLNEMIQTPNQKR